MCGDEDEDDRLILADLENSDRIVARECAKAGAKRCGDAKTRAKRRDGVGSGRDLMGDS